MIVHEYVGWSRGQNIPVGPGRGSAAGSLVAWALGITGVNPIRHNLLFERFLNPERVSLPDIDVDFCERRRDEVIRHLKERYGADKVVQIAAFSALGARVAVKDIGRSMGVPFQETEALAKMIPEKTTLAEALENTPDLAARYKTDPAARKILDYALEVEGNARHVSIHASGVVISDIPAAGRVPLAQRDGALFTQFDGPMVEKLGLIKFDLLGLKAVTVIHDVLSALETPPDLYSLPLDDPSVYEMLSRGETDGVFQLESQGMRSCLAKMRPACFEDLSLMVALYRPGPLESGMVESFIRRKHGEEAVVYPHPLLEECLKETYGVIVYQEQVMQIARIIAGYTPGQADILRRAMGKKKAGEMAAERGRFIDGAISNGVEREKAEEIFDLMEKFAAYGFNKSHSVAYALLSYQTSWLKAHYPAQFMAAVMTSATFEKNGGYARVCRKLGLDVSGPSVNESGVGFTARGAGILWGLSAIKGVGGKAGAEIVTARSGGAFKTFFDFCRRVNKQRVNKKVMEALIKSGACDCFGHTRKALLDSLKKVLEAARNDAKDFALADREEMPRGKLLRDEAETLGFYISGHPASGIEGFTPLGELAEMTAGSQVECAGVVVKVKKIKAKRGALMAFVTLEDVSGSAEITIFPDEFSRLESLLKKGSLLVVDGKVSGYKGGVTFDGLRLVCQDVKVLDG